MKRTLLLIASLLLLTGAMAQTASLALKDKEGNDITGTTVDVLYAPEAGYGSFKLDVVNTASTAKTVKVKKIEMSMLPEVTGLTICWVSCYPPFVFESPEPITIDPAGICTNFEGDITYPAGTKGTSTVKFVFFDVDNPTDTSFVTVNYNLGTVGIGESIVLKNAKVSNAYPNPAASMVYFDYQLPANTNNAKIKISNLLGTELNVVQLSKSEGKAGIDVSNLQNGVYFYSLIVDNAATMTRKFVVKK